MSFQSDLLLLTADDAAYQIEQSLRFNWTSDSTRLYRTFGSDNSNANFTISFWCKRAQLGAYNSFIAAQTNASNYEHWMWYDNDAIGSSNGVSGTANNNKSTALFRDPSAWYHVVWKNVASGATTVYINNTQVLSFTRQHKAVNKNVNHNIGVGADSGSFGANFYLAEYLLVDGSALEPSSFAEPDDNGAWRPIAYSGSYGTNGFYLKFDPSATNGIGHDHSGNGNNFTPTGFSTTGAINIGYPQALTAGSGSVTNPSLAFDGNTGTEAVASSSTTITFTPPTPISFSTKLEFWTASGNGPGSNDQRYSFNGGAEVTCSGGEWTTVVNGSGTLTSLAIRNTLTAISRLNAVRVDNNILLSNSGAGNDVLSDTPTTNWCTLNPLRRQTDNCALSNGNLTAAQGNGTFPGATATFALSSGKWYYEFTITTKTATPLCGLCRADYTSGGTGRIMYRSDGRYIYSDGTEPSGPDTFTTGDVIGVAIDLDDTNGKIRFYKNGTIQTALSGLDNVTSDLALSTFGYVNIYIQMYSGDVCDVNFGQRAFAYTPPTGFKALNTANLPAPTVKDGSQYFNTVL